MWEPTIMHIQANYKLVVAQRSEASADPSAPEPRQRQCPVDRAPLAAAVKDVKMDHIALVSELELLLVRDIIWSAEGNHGPSSSNAANCLRKRSPQPSGNSSTPPALTQASPIWPELHRHSSGIYVFVSPDAGTDIPQIRIVKPFLTKIICCDSAQVGGTFFESLYV